MKKFALFSLSILIILSLLFVYYYRTTQREGLICPEIKPGSNPGQRCPMGYTYSAVSNICKKNNKYVGPCATSLP